MKILSWNVNGLRAIAKKGIKDFLNKENFDVICLQEVKCFECQVENEIKDIFSEYDYIWHKSELKGYSGVAIFFKGKGQKKNHFGDFNKFSDEGRLVEVDFGDFVLLNGYFPNGGDRSDGTPMLGYKLDFYEDLFSYLAENKAKGKNIIICGDFNIVHKEIDIARPKENQNSIGFLPVEREKISKLISNGYTDLFRYFFPEKKDEYTWWSYRAGARQNNVGWRIDYFFVNNEFLPKIKSFSHKQEINGSDHCPLIIELL